MEFKMKCNLNGIQIQIYLNFPNLGELSLIQSNSEINKTNSEKFN